MNETPSNSRSRKKTKINFADVAEIYNIQDGKIFENVEVLKSNSKELDFQFLQDSIRQIKIFSDLSTSQLKLLATKFFYCQNIEEEDFIFQQSTKPSCFFIVDSGQLVVVKDGVDIKKLNRGSAFGELALIHNKPRAAAIKVKSNKVFMWGMSRQIFRNVSIQFTAENFKVRREFIEKVAVLKVLPEVIKDRLASVLQTQDFYENDTIIRSNEKSENLYIIVEGEVAELDIDRKVTKKIRTAQHFGILGGDLGSNRNSSGSLS